MKPLPPRHEPFADATVPEPHASGLRHGPVRALPWTAILAIALLVPVGRRRELRPDPPSST